MYKWLFFVVSIFMLIGSPASATLLMFDVSATSLPVDYVPPLIVSLTGTFEADYSTSANLTVTCTAHCNFDEIIFSTLVSIKLRNATFPPGFTQYVAEFQGHGNEQLQLDFAIPQGDTILDFMQGVIYGFQLQGNEGGFANTADFSLGTITETSSPTPEPSSWVLLLLGFAGLASRAIGQRVGTPPPKRHDASG